MSATYSNKSRSRREPLSPQTIAARIVLVIFLIALFFAIFVFPWMFA
jgi:hypothetical protein